VSVSRLLLLWASLLAALTGASAQEILSFRVSASIGGPAFVVDGELFRRPATFLWPRGSKHVISIVAGSMSRETGNPACPVAPNTPIQYEPDCRTRYTFSGWINDRSTPVGGQVWTQSITVDGTSSALVAQFSVEYAISVSQFDGSFGGPTGECQAKANRPFTTPGIGESIGVVFFGSLCFDYSGVAWSTPGVFEVNALPMAGYAFDGWSYSGTPLPSLAKVTVSGPANLLVRFVPAKRVRFYTDPPTLKVRIDRAEISTVDPVSNNELAPIPGLLDFAPNSRHVIGAPSPQLNGGKNWVFSEWSNGLKQDGQFTADSNTSTVDVLTARFVRGVTATFLTEPRGLRLNIDGRENWPNYGFVWGLGSSHSFSAPVEQLDSNGRRWKFRAWKHSTAAAHQFTVSQTDIDTGNLSWTAAYDAVPRLEIQSNLPGIRVDVDGVPCATPCRVDQPEGTKIRVSAPRVLAIDDASRLEFSGWSDSAAADRVVILTSDLTLRAAWQRANRLTIQADPPASADVALSPASADGFYQAGTSVEVALDPRPGFRFRRWEGDLTGTWPQGVLAMSGPRSAMARLERHPYLPSTAVTPAPGPTPVGAVAPGSLIRISGASLAAAEELGSRSPLVQTLGGIVVMVGDRLLSLVSVAPDSIVALLPSDLALGEARLTCRGSLGQEVSTDFPIARNAPALFPDSLIHEDGSAVTLENPARAGERLSVSGTGFGPLLLPVVDGFAVPENPRNPVADPVFIQVGSVTIPPESSLAEPGTSGRVRTRFRLPFDVSGPLTDVSVRVGEAVSNTLSVPVTNP